jgi:hypothetical protein
MINVNRDVIRQRLNPLVALQLVPVAASCAGVQTPPQ